MKTEEKINIYKSSTNSELGSYHWFHTLLAQHMRIGKFLINNEAPSEEILREWGQQLFETSKEPWMNIQIKIKHLLLIY